MSRTSRTLLAVVLVSAMVRPGAAPFAASAPDDDVREERIADGRLAFRDNCLMRHSEEMVERTRLTEKQWAAEVDKMIGWGAPVRPEAKGVLLEYLVSQFSDPKSAPIPPPKRTSLRAALALNRPEVPRTVPGDAARGATLFANNCATCHGPQGLGGDLGTCLVEKPVLLRPTDFARAVRKGLRRMPGFEAALKPEAEFDILAWLRTARFEPPAP